MYILVSWDGQTDPNVNIEGIFKSKENAKNKILMIEQNSTVTWIRVI